MEKTRQANLDLLRILLMCTIPVYHLMLYNGVIYVDYHANTILGLILSVGGAIPADYAFMAISAYYLQEAGTSMKLHRFLRFGELLATMYIIKVIVLRGLFGFHNTRYFVDLFLMQGAWWYAKAYFLLLLVYPILNRFLRWAQGSLLVMVTFGTGILFVAAGVRNEVNFFSDFLAFLLVYLIMGGLRRKQFEWYFGIRTKTCSMAALALGIYFLMLFLCIGARVPGSIIPKEIGLEIVKRIAGRYSLLAAIMGGALFFLARSITVQSRKWISGLAKCTTGVFLLHDPVMGVFWYFEKCWNDFSYYSRPAFLGWTLIYLATCFTVAYVIGKIYGKWAAPLWESASASIHEKWQLIVKPEIDKKQ